VLVNVIAFALLIYLFTQFLPNEANEWLKIAPLLLSGLWMSLGRDLAEIVESMFLLLAIMAFTKRRKMQFFLFTALALFSREPVAVILFPISLMWSLEILKKSSKELLNTAILFLPYLLLFIWKYFLHLQYQTPSIFEGASNIGLPFVGIYEGIYYGFHQIDSKASILEYLIWWSFLLWNFWIIAIVIRKLELRLSSWNSRLILSYSWIIALVFFLSLSYSVYVDDWAFVRVLSSFNLFSLLILALQPKLKISSLFWIFSGILCLSTILRLIIRI